MREESPSAEPRDPTLYLRQAAPPPSWAKMLRFFSRRKVKGRADQKVSGRRVAGKYSKHALPCNIMLLDGSDLALDIGVSRVVA